MHNLTIGLIGNPNCGKTTLFNTLTGDHQKVGNWPGVTVDRKSGYFLFDEHQIEVVDLPGIYSLSAGMDESAIDEQITINYLLSNEASLIVNILDANNLERNLYLTTQLLELDVPVVLAINMMDIARKRGIRINIEKLSDYLGCPVIPIVAKKRLHIEGLKKTIVQNFQKNRTINYPPEISQTINNLANKLAIKNAFFIVTRLFESDEFVKQKVSAKFLSIIEEQKQVLAQKFQEDTDVLIADARFSEIHQLTKQVVKRSKKQKNFTTVIDRIVLNRILGLPIFLGIMYVLFSFAIGLGGVLQDAFQIMSSAIFVHGLAHLLSVFHVPLWLSMMIVSGIGKGLNTTITLIPVLTVMFFSLALLESTGYISRAAFVVDRLMRFIGLPGKSFVPMLIGFGCNVPAIMAARTLETPRDRTLTILMSPFMSCGARLAIYAVFTAAFFPQGGKNIVFVLYLVGILVAIFTGFILRKTILHGPPSFLVAELPPYHLPSMQSVLSSTWLRLKEFVWKAGKIIVPFCFILSALNVNFKNQNDSLLSISSKKITPIFSPMGIQENNWPATVALISGVVSKEIVVASLNTLYTNDSETSVWQFASWQGSLNMAFNSIKQHFTIKQDEIKSTNIYLNKHKDIYGMMYEKFNGPKGAFAYLLFVLLYFPCIPTLATMFRELNWRWATFSIFWNTGIAYSVATTYYQLANFSQNPGQAFTTILSIILVFVSIITGMRFFSKRENL